MSELNNELGIPNEVYQKDILKSFKALGNNYRIHKLIEKLQAGKETVYIATIGGSVTEGGGAADWNDGYAYKFVEALTKKYAKDSSKVVYDNAALSGSSSATALVRYENDVVKTLGHTPDLLTIEFAVNDYLEPTQGRGFEYMVRSALTANENAAVIAIHAAAAYGNQQHVTSPFAEYYNIPQVSILDAVNAEGSGFDTKEKSTYYTDNVHPTTPGHRFTVDCLMALVEKLYSAAEDKPFPVPAEWKSPKSFADYKTIYRGTPDSNVKIAEGGFSGKDDQSQQVFKKVKPFDNNWHYDGTNHQSFTMELDCKNLIMIYKDRSKPAEAEVNKSEAAVNSSTGNNSSTKNTAPVPFTFGQAEIYVDGNKSQTLNGCTGTGWGNCVPVMLIDETECKHHKVEIKLAEGDENKGFSILGLGYSK